MNAVCLNPSPSCLRSKFTSDERGSALLEASVVIPVLFTIGLGVFEFGNYFYQRQLMEAGVRDAARYLAALPRGHAGSEADAQSIALTGEIGGTDYRVDWWRPGQPDFTFNVTPTGYTNSFTVGGNTYTLRNEDAGNIWAIEVESTVRYQSLGYLTGYLGFGNLVITVSHEERHIGTR